MGIPQSEIQKYLPQYLSNGAKEALKNSLDDFPNNLEKMIMPENIFNEYKSKLLQSDIIECKNIYDGHNAKVMIISNSCDNSSENERNFPICVSFVAILSLEKMKNVFEKYGIDKQAIDNKIDAIKKQQVTNMFYLPNDMVALLDRTMHLDYNKFSKAMINKIASLSDYGFYVFLFKLSYHFTRLREGVQRG
ncbi:hypothetical protein [uncultured Campylobacter sp.]|uniref:hypothetical protein n=1 Tax=uncultured Campylobacter sp. TaxID=218934 RepID=UPI00260BC4F6|nr:hypothetical protein [uncultured Campylobacter sp.]